MPHLSFLRMLSRIPGRGILEAGLAGAFLLLAGCKTPLAEKPTPGEPEAPASERAPLDEAPLSVEKLNLERVTLKPPLRSGRSGWPVQSVTAPPAPSITGTSAAQSQSCIVASAMMSIWPSAIRP